MVCKALTSYFLYLGGKLLKRAAKLRINGKTETSQRSSNNKTKRRSFRKRGKTFKTYQKYNKSSNNCFVCGLHNNSVDIGL